MATHQHALIVKTGPGPQHTRGLDELNIRLERGWRVVQMAPMGGASVGSAGTTELCLAALVIIERAEEPSAEVTEKVEEKPEEIVEEIVEGNGAELPRELQEGPDEGELS